MNTSAKVPCSRDEGQSPPNAGLWPAYLVLAAAFGPYVLPSYGVMLSQVALYPCAVWALVSLSSRRRWETVRWMRAIPVTLAFMVVWTVPGTLARQTSGSVWPLLAQLDNYLQPLFSVLVGLAVVARQPKEAAYDALARCVGLVLVLLAANSCVAVWSSLAGEVPAFLDYWRPLGKQWAGPRALDIMEVAVSTRRWTGIFVQPAEAGLAYSIGLLLALCALKQSTRTGPLAAGIVALLLGGSVAASKGFLLGFVLAAIYVAMPPRSGRMLAALGAGAAGLVVFSAIPGLVGYNPVSQIEDKVTSERGLVASASGGRYGSEGVTSAAHAPVITASPWFGYGLNAESHATKAFDSEFLAYLLVGGIPMVGAYLWLLVMLALHGLRPPARGSAGGALILMLAVFVPLGGLGMPVLNGNRVGQVLGLFLPLVLATIPRSAPQASRGATRPSPPRRT